MKKGELKQMMEDTLEKSKSLLVRDGYLVPVAFIHSENEIGVIGLTFKDQNEKEIQIAAIGKLARKKNADAVFIAIESWYVTSDKKDLSIVPSEHPMRKECISLFGECEEGNIMIIQKFERDGEEIIFGEKSSTILGVSKFNFGIKKRLNEELRDLN